MARIRSIKPEFWTDRKTAARLTRDARLLYISLWNLADEHARLHGDTRFVKGHCLPYDDDLSLAAIDGLLRELEQAGRVVRYDVEGDPYLFLPHLPKHQRLEPAKVPSRLPEPPSEPRANKSARRTDESAPDAESSETIDALQVAGGREQVAGDAAPTARDDDGEESEGQYVNRLARTYTDPVPLSNFPAVAGVVRKAVRTGLYSEQQIRDGLAALADEGRSVTTDSLRYAIEGMPTGRLTGSKKAEQDAVLRREMAAAQGRLLELPGGAA